MWDHRQDYRQEHPQDHRQDHRSEAMQLELVRDAIVYRLGGDLELLPKGTRLKGPLVRVDALWRVAVVKDEHATYRVNLEDLDRFQAMQS